MRNAQVFDLSTSFAGQIAAARPLVKEAYDKLGEAQVKELHYHVGNIHRKLDARLNTSTIDKVVRMCRRAFPQQKPIPLSVIKSELQAIYDEMSIQHKAKATDIQA